MSFSYKESEELKKECARELRKNGHRSMKHSKSRKSSKKVNEQKDQVKDSKLLGYSNYEEWSLRNNKYNEENELIEPWEANPDQIGYWED